MIAHEVDVAGWGGLVAGDGAEEADVGAAVFGEDGEDLVAVLAEGLEGGDGLGLGGWHWLVLYVRVGCVSARSLMRVRFAREKCTLRAVLVGEVVLEFAVDKPVAIAMGVSDESMLLI